MSFVRFFVKVKQNYFVHVGFLGFASSVPNIVKYRIIFSADIKISLHFQYIGLNLRQW